MSKGLLADGYTTTSSKIYYFGFIIIVFHLSEDVKYEVIVSDRGK